MIDNKTVAVLQDTLICPDVIEDLISVSQLCDDGYTFLFSKDGWEGIHKDKSKCLSGP
jgi:hypothetical protein